MSPGECVLRTSTNKISRHTYNNLYPVEGKSKDLIVPDEFLEICVSWKLSYIAYIV